MIGWMLVLEANEKILGLPIEYWCTLQGRRATVTSPQVLRVIYVENYAKFFFPARKSDSKVVWPGEFDANCSVKLEKEI